MIKNKLHFPPITLICVFALTFATTAYPSQGGSQSPNSVNSTPSRGREHLNNFAGNGIRPQQKGSGVRFIPPPLSNQAGFGFDEDGRPRKREGGGSRGGECWVENKPLLTALVPDTGVGLTTSESPTFWFYVPYTLTPKHSVEFVLKQGETSVYQTQIPGRGTSPGIVSFRLPSTVSLDTDKNYDWYFVVYCDSQNQEEFTFVNGSVRRVERPELKRQLESSTPLERITLYATEGIWYEAVTGLAELHRDAPQDNQLSNDWAGLLQSVGLENLASESFVPCCSSEP